MKTKNLLRICLACMLASCAETEIPSFTDSSLYIFGDSLSDVGNANVATAGLLPDKNYYQGRFSNGPVYADKLAASIGTPMKPSRAYGSNYAFAGVKSIAVNAQVFNYQENVDGTADASAIYIVWSGANDLLEMLQQQDTTTAISNAIVHIENAIVKLSRMGAKNIIVPNQVNMANLPRTIQLESLTLGSIAAALMLTQQFNGALSDMLDKLAIADIPIETIRFDTYNLFEDIVNNPATYSLENISEACYVKDRFGIGSIGNIESIELSGDEKICTNPSLYLFWDDIHPTTAVHEILFQQLLIKINEL